MADGHRERDRSGCHCLKALLWSPHMPPSQHEPAVCLDQHSLAQQPSPRPAGQLQSQHCGHTQVTLPCQILQLTPQPPYSGMLQLKAWRTSLLALHSPRPCVQEAAYAEPPAATSYMQPPQNSTYIQLPPRHSLGPGKDSLGAASASSIAAARGMPRSDDSAGAVCSSGLQAVLQRFAHA